MNHSLYQTFEGTISKRSSWSGYANSVRKPSERYMSEGRVNDLLYIMEAPSRIPFDHKGNQTFGYLCWLECDYALYQRNFVAVYASIRFKEFNTPPITNRLTKFFIWSTCVYMSWLPFDSKRWITRLVGRWKTGQNPRVNVNCRHIEHRHFERTLRH